MSLNFLPSLIITDQSGILRALDGSSTSCVSLQHGLQYSSDSLKPAIHLNRPLEHFWRLQKTHLNRPLTLEPATRI